MRWGAVCSGLLCPLCAKTVQERRSDDSSVYDSIPIKIESYLECVNKFYQIFSTQNFGQLQVRHLCDTKSRHCANFWSSETLKTRFYACASILWKITSPYKIIFVPFLDYMDIFSDQSYTDHCTSLKFVLIKLPNYLRHLNYLRPSVKYVTYKITSLCST